VLDGGGVTPDIKLPAKKQSPFVKALLEQQVVFNYANDYVMNNDSIRDVTSFKFNDYSAFVGFVNASDFEYKTFGEEEYEALITSVDNTDLKSDLNQSLTLLKANFEEVKRKDFEKYESELINEIEKELISRYFYQKGLTQINLRNDTEVMKAVSVLNDQNQYKNLLNK
jgi:carboxyl-terminal processing protease